MAPNTEEKGLIGNLQNLVNQLESPSVDKPAPSLATPPTVCAPLPSPQQPIVEACMSCPPPILAPTAPCPVNPLVLPTSCGNTPPSDIIPENNNGRYSNFYNNYNVNWRRPVIDPLLPPISRRCESYELPRRRPERPKPDGSCPTGFKTCQMALTAPPGCHPCAPWCAEVQPCPPKPRVKLSTFYRPRPCTRPCCKHWHPKEPPCIYDDPCRAHCYDHPVGIKPSGRFP